MITQLQGAAEQPAAPSGSRGVFGFIGDKLRLDDNRRACFDGERLNPSDQRGIVQDPTLTHEGLALAYATC